MSAMLGRLFPTPTQRQKSSVEQGRGGAKGSLCWGLQLEVSFNFHRSEDGRENLQGEKFVGSHSFRTRFSVRLADAVAERQSSANHTVRMMHPSFSAACCVAHDEGIWSTAKQWEGSGRVRGRGLMRWRCCPCELAVWDCVQLCVLGFMR